MNLAVLRARSGRKVLLVDTNRSRLAHGWASARRENGRRPWVSSRVLDGQKLQAELGVLNEQYNDIVIDTAGRNTAESRSVFVAAKLVLVLVRPRMAALATQYQLIDTLNAARVFNPAIRVLFVIVGDDNHLTQDELATARAYMSRVALASLASTTVRAPDEHEYGVGRCICDAETCDPERAAEMHALYREVYGRLPNAARDF